MSSWLSVRDREMSIDVIIVMAATSFISHRGPTLFHHTQPVFHLNEKYHCASCQIKSRFSLYRLVSLLFSIHYVWDREERQIAKGLI